jgi:hypothetical protein
MASMRLFFLAASVLPLSLVACGGSSEDGSVVPEGSHYGYVVSKATVVPSKDNPLASLSIDLGSKLSAKLDNMTENRLGEALGALTTFFNIQKTVDTAISNGSIILLIDFQTKDFANTGNAGLAVKFGSNPMPAACTSPTDVTCGHHLTGSAMFSIAADSPSDASLGGKITNGAFSGGPGDVTLQIALGSTAPIELNLLHARAKGSAISETGIMSVNVGGLLTTTDLTTKVGPAIQTQVAAIITTDCTPAAAPPGCGCKTGSTGATVMGVLDGDLDSVHDCKISTEELLGFPLVKSLLGPDSCSKDSCTAPDSLSVGVKVEAVKATFPM